MKTEATCRVVRAQARVDELSRLLGEANRAAAQAEDALAECEVQSPAPLQPRTCASCRDFLPATRECGAVLIRGRYPMTDLPVMGCGIWRAMALEIRAALPAQESDHE